MTKESSRGIIILSSGLPSSFIDDRTVSPRDVPKNWPLVIFLSIIDGFRIYSYYSAHLRKSENVKALVGLICKAEEAPSDRYALGIIPRSLSRSVFPKSWLLASVTPATRSLPGARLAARSGRSYAVSAPGTKL